MVGSFLYYIGKQKLMVIFVPSHFQNDFFFLKIFSHHDFSMAEYFPGGGRNSNLRSIILTGEMIVENVWERVAEIGGRCFQGEKFGIR